MKYEESFGNLCAQLTGCLLHLSNTTRPGICYAAGYFSRFMHYPTSALWKAGKHVFRYFKGTKTHWIMYRKEHTHNETVIMGLSDSDWAQGLRSRKSISGYVFFYNGGPTYWISKRQNMVEKSLVEVEFVAFSYTIRDALWIRKVMQDVRNTPVYFPTLIKEDSFWCISVSENDIINDRNKCIDGKYQMVSAHVKREIYVWSTFRRKRWLQKLWQSFYRLRNTSTWFGNFQCVNNQYSTRYEGLLQWNHLCTVLAYNEDTE